MKNSKSKNRKEVNMSKKTYIGISRDHSGSMSSLRRPAMADYNTLIKSLKDASRREDQDTIASVIECGVEEGTRFVVQNSNIYTLRSITNYHTVGSTPLFKSIDELINVMQMVPDAHDPDVAFLIMAITDGEDNASGAITGPYLSNRIRTLQASDRWTFTFRVPFGYKNNLVRLGIPAGNILEWDQTEEGFKQATFTTTSAVDQFYRGRTAGMTSSKAFYTDLSGVTSKDLSRNLTDVSKQVEVWPISKYSNTTEIRTFVEGKAGHYIKGAAFYQLTKSEEVQDYKQIAIRDVDTGKIFIGREARDLLQIPHTGTIRLRPGHHRKYEIYIQSTSVNRKLVGGTNLLYYPHAVY